MKVIWRHQDPKAPVLLYSELDSERYETRKIEIFANGQCGFADSREGMGGTFLGTAPVPRLEEIATDLQFVPAEITAEEFERKWFKRHEQAQPGD